MMHEPTRPQANLSFDSPELSRHKLTVKEFAGSRAAQERLIEEWQAEIEQIVKEICPLDFFPQRFELVNLQELQVILAREGFPRRYEHYRFGQNYESQSTRDTYGLGRTYELVINTNPCVAYLLDTNSVMETRVVMAHVYFHNIFFKHNTYFAATDRSMLHTMGEHAERIKRYKEQHGTWAVEKFLDICHSLGNLIDVHSVAIQRSLRDRSESSILDRRVDEPIQVARFDVPEYLDRYVNPPEVLRAQADKERTERERARKIVPAEPQQDILLFLMKHAPLEDWHRDVISIVRDESYYFAPQRMTKIMNEGWASYWHSKIMTERLLPLYPSETVDYCDFNAAVLAPWGKQGINPYRLGVRLFRDIEDRWNTGKFGPEWDNCRGMAERAAWDRRLGRGLEEICNAMVTHNDLTFIAKYMTPEFCAENQMFVTQRDGDDEPYVSSEEFSEIRSYFSRSLANLGQPKLTVVNADHDAKGELVIIHSYDGQMLDFAMAEPTCKNLHKLWGRPISVLTRDKDGDPVLLTYDGKRFDMDLADDDYLEYLED